MGIHVGKSRSWLAGIGNHGGPIGAAVGGANDPLGSATVVGYGRPTKESDILVRGINLYHIVVPALELTNVGRGCFCPGGAAIVGDPNTKIGIGILLAAG